MVPPRPPKNSHEMRALQEKYGRDVDIAIALGVTKHAVVQLRLAYKLPAETGQASETGQALRPYKADKIIGEAEIAVLYGGRRYR